MKIIGIDGMSADELNFELQRGAKFVLFQYCFSVLILTFRRSSDVFFIRTEESALGKSLPYSAISFLAGWWGIPWGPIYTIGSLIQNFQGGKDVTQEVIASFNASSP